MSRNMIPVGLGLTVLPLAAMGLAAYLLVNGGPGLGAAAAIFLLGAGTLATALLVLTRLSRQERWLRAQEEALAESGERAEDVAARLATVEWHVSQPQDRLEGIVADIAALRQEVRDLAGAFERGEEARLPAEPPQQAETGDPHAADAPEPQQQQGGADQLELLLEPMIELATGITLHYRALVDLTDEHGRGVGHEELIRKADLGGMRPALDAHMMMMVAPVLRRLRQKNPPLRIFVPIGLMTLSSREEAQNIIGLLQRDLDVTGGMVFEFAQRELAALDGEGIENLARLARLGATLALREVYLGGLDLTALRQLGVRFLSFPPHAVDAGSGPTPAWRDFVQYARAMQVQIIISDIKTPQQATAASKHARFGHGSFFAPPRKVRPDAGVAAALGRSASVA